jgi:hypothetical protein
MLVHAPASLKIKPDMEPHVCTLIYRQRMLRLRTALGQCAGRTPACRRGSGRYKSTFNCQCRSLRRHIPSHFLANDANYGGKVDLKLFLSVKLDTKNRCLLSGEVFRAILGRQEEETIATAPPRRGAHSSLPGSAAGARRRLGLRRRRGLTAWSCQRLAGCPFGSHSPLRARQRGGLLSAGSIKRRTPS